MFSLRRARATAPGQPLSPRSSDARTLLPLSQAQYNDKVVDPSLWVPCLIVGVHFDDGPEKPYYTIRFDRGGEEIEKQTQVER